jgi:hypothetical protein
VETNFIDFSLFVDHDTWEERSSRN